MSVVPKVIYRSSAFAIRIPMTFFYRKGKIHPKIHIESHRTMNNQNSLEKNKVGDLHFLISKLSTKLQSSKQFGADKKAGV